MRRSRSSRNSPPVVSPHDNYVLQCECGAILEGPRENHSQQLACPECGGLHYVLPRDVYPRPQILPPPPVVTFAAVEEPPADEAIIDLVDDEPVDFDLLEGTDLVEPVAPASLPVPPPPPTPEPKPRSSRAPRPPRRPPEKTDPPPRVWVDRPGHPWLKRRIVTVTGLALVILGFTIWWGLHNQRIAAAEVTLREELAALKSEGASADPERRRVSAARAAQAAEILGADDPAARYVRQLHRSLTAIDGLSSYAPVEIVRERPAEGVTVDAWESHFRIHHSGHWLVIRAEVVRETRTVDERELVSLRVDFPLTFDLDEVRLVWEDLPDWAETLPFENGRAAVCVAAQFEAAKFTHPSELENWAILLRPATSFLWTDERLAREIGLYSSDDPDAEEFLGLLRAQRMRAGLPTLEEL